MKVIAIFCTVLVVGLALAEDNNEKQHDKRASAESTSYVTSSPKSAYATVTSSPSYATSKAPLAYSSKVQTQSIGSQKNNYAINQPVTYEHVVSQPQPGHLRLAYSQPPTYAKLGPAQVAYAFPQQNFLYEPQVQYAQPDAKYVFAQPTGKVAPAGVQAYKVGQPTGGAVAYAAIPAHPTYSPANSVSSFSFKNPHVSYSNLGLLSQVLGKGYSPQQSSAPVHSAGIPQHVSFVAAPVASHAPAGPAAGHAVAQQFQYVTSSGHPVNYAGQSGKQGGAVQYVTPEIQYHSAPQVQYQSVPQYQQQSTHSQYQGAQYQSPQYQSPQYQSPQYQSPQYQSPQYQYATAAQAQYSSGSQQTAQSAPKYYYTNSPLLANLLKEGALNFSYA